ncbi:hypothetical protein KKA14_11525 [bacterium]|nr:hypothetical protein [bacterium]
MKKNSRIFCVVLLLFVTLCPTSHAQSPELADKYWNQAQSLKKQNKYLEAARMYEKAAESEMASPKPRLGDLAIEHNQAGICYDSVDLYEKAI